MVTYHQNPDGLQGRSASGRSIKKLELFRSLALSFFVCGVLVYVLIIVYDKKEEMDLESNLNIQVLLPNPTGNLPSGFAGHGR